MSKTLSLRVTERQLAALERLKRRLSQHSIGGTLQLLLGEKLREAEYTYIIFRNTAAGRFAFVEGDPTGRLGDHDGRSRVRV
ncbi:MAG: hypothetical protein ACR2JC_06160 [Chloroflexota bacterium]|nr:MAG: hypothetical protein DLM70_14515 [Chloroflexota bacterium]